MLLGISFPPFQTGIFAAIAFIPFFILFESIEDYPTAFRYSYLWLFVFHCITLYWAGGFTHGKDGFLMLAGTALLVFHPFFYYPFVWAFMFFRKQFGFKASIFTFPLFWIGIEYTRSIGEYSFPWLTLGNTQTYDLSVIQIASVTGVYGISFWLLCLNVLIYFLYAKITVKDWKPLSPQAIIFAFVLIAFYLFPKIYGRIQLNKSAEVKQHTQFRVGIVQPNIDPFEKWEKSVDAQLAIHQQLTNELAKQHVDLVLWPETAVPFYILDPNNRYYFNLIKHQVDSLNLNLLTGMPDIHYYHENESIPKSSKTAKNGERYDSYNSSMLLQHGIPEVQTYSKMILVPYAERVPYSDELSFLNAMKWNFGLGGWGFGKDTTVFQFYANNSEAKFSNLICYESVYPGFITNFVRKGAQFLTVITNDSWWGNTSGARQHQQYAILRAVENRRWVARCANGGISCFIDPYGNIFQPTTMFTQVTITQDISLNDELTFYSKHGDWLAESCIILGLFLLSASAGKKIYYSIRKRDSDEIR